MKRLNALVIFLALIAIGTITVSGQAPVKPQIGVLSILKAGQSVNLKDIAGRYEISTYDDGLTALSHRVIEVGPDFVTVEDIAGVAETRIPIFSIKSFVRFKVPK